MNSCPSGGSIGAVTAQTIAELRQPPASSAAGSPDAGTRKRLALLVVG